MKNTPQSSDDVKVGSVIKDKGVGPVSGATKGQLSTGIQLKPLTAFDVFSSCVNRASNLIKIHKAAHGDKARPETYLADAHRASVVLSVSALDAFIRTFLIHQIRKLVAAQDKNLPAALSAEIRKFVKEEVLLEAARKNDLLDRVEKAFRVDFERRSFQGVSSIEEAMKMIGHNNIFHTIAISAGVNEDTLKKDLDKYTKRRHIIAHAGDYNLSQNPATENKITKKDAELCIKLITMIAKQIHSLE